MSTLIDHLSFKMILKRGENKGNCTLEGGKGYD